MSQIRMELVREQGGEPEGIIIDGKSYKVRDTTTNSIRVPEAAISDIKLIETPHEVRFEVELLPDRAMPAFIVDLGVVDNESAHVVVDIFFERERDQINVDKLARAISRYLLTKSSIGELSYDGNSDLVVVEAVLLLEGKTFSQILAPVRTVLTGLTARLDELTRCIEEEFWKV